MKKALAISAILVGGLLLFFAVTILAFYHLIQVGEFRRFFVQEFEARTGLKVEIGDAQVEMGRFVGVSFRDLVLRDPNENRLAIRAPRLVVRVALLPLLHRKLVFYGLRVEQPKVEIFRDERGKTPWLDLMLNLPLEQQDAAQFSLDLREIRISRGEITFIDRLAAKTPVQTRFANIALALRRVRNPRVLGLTPASRNSAAGGSAPSGIDFDLSASVHRDGQRADVAVTGRAWFPETSLDIRAAWLEADVTGANLPLALVWEHYGRPLVDNAPSGSLSYRGRWQGNLSEGAHVNGQIRFSGVAAGAPNAFPGALTLGDGQLDAAFDWKPQEIRFQRLDLRSTGLTLAVRGSLRSLDGRDPQVDLHLTTPFLPVTTVRNYVPTKLFRSERLESLMAGLDQGEIQLTKAAISGRLSELGRAFEPGQEERLSLEAKVREAGGALGRDHPIAFSDFSGRIVFEHGVVRYDGFSGNVGLSRLTRISGTHRRPFSGGPLELRIKGRADLAQLREQLPPGTLPPVATKMIGGLQDLAGSAGLDLNVRTDFASAYHYDGVVSLEGVRFEAGGFSLSDLNGDLLVSPNEIRAEHAAALLADSPVQFRLLVKDFASETGSFDLAVDTAGVRASEALRLLLSLDTGRSPGMVRGSVRYQGSLAAVEKRKFTGSLELIGVEVPLKVFSEPFRQVNGRVRLDGEAIDFQDLTARAGGYDFSLSGRWMGGEKPTFLFSLSSPEMDIHYILPRRFIPDIEWYERLRVRGKLTIDRAIYHRFNTSDFKADLVVEKRIWRLQNVFARAQGGTIEGAAAFNDRLEPAVFTVEPNIKGVPLQEVLSWFEIGTTEVTGKVQLAGKFEFAGRTPAERKRRLNGAFRARIEDGIARRFQLLVRILSFLDLSRWFTLRLPNLNQEGMHFRSISADFKVAQGIYSTQNFFVDSEDLRISGAGDLDGTKGELEFVIAVRPFPGLESAWNYVPVIGTGLAAIKNSLLVASFNVTGPVNDPSLTPAPLSTLSEFFFGALQIPKGLIGIPTIGGKKSADAPKPSGAERSAGDSK